ncbi:DUF4910 domain-containing protein [bacterium 1XD42-94]|nr:DUF4910 domain-containing protein [bacterium 1XD42-76]NBK06914.1 DUF4910 domain-containing protein [bacterium 1XD42-94]
MYDLAKRIFPIYRSITGDGVRTTLQILKDVCKELRICEIESGKRVFDWTIPNEWHIEEAYIENEAGIRIVDFNENNLHVVGYSTPVDRWVEREELLSYLYTQPDQPDVIPYVTSYYTERYGFCMTEDRKNRLEPGRYHMVVKSRLFPGCMNWGELLLKGETEEEVCFSTNICHPGLGNNETSGPVVLIHLAKWLSSLEHRRYTYRFLFLPETIGSIAYLSQNLEHMQNYVKAGFVVTCVGDDHHYSYIESRKGNTLADRLLKHVLKWSCPEFQEYSFLKRGSDERQYCAPGVDLPFCVFCRSKFHEYKEYHTSKDDLNFISADGLEHSFLVLQNVVSLLEKNRKYRMKILCEPQLGKRGLYPTISQKNTYGDIRKIQDFIAYADGCLDFIDVCETIRQSAVEMLPVLERLIKEGLIEALEE